MLLKIENSYIYIDAVHFRIQSPQCLVRISLKMQKFLRVLYDKLLSDFVIRKFSVFSLPKKLHNRLKLLKNAAFLKRGKKLSQQYLAHLALLRQIVDGEKPHKTYFLAN